MSVLTVSLSLSLSLSLSRSGTNLNLLDRRVQLVELRLRLLSRSTRPSSYFELAYFAYEQLVLLGVQPEHSVVCVADEPSESGWPDKLRTK